MANVVGRSWVIPKRGDGSVYMEDLVPVLSSLSVPSGTITTTTATASVTTSVNVGILYCAVTASSTKPTSIQIKTGKDHNGANALFSTFVSVSAAGIIQIPILGLSGTALKHVHVIHEANSFDSAVISTSFTLSITSIYTLYSAASVAAETNGFFNIRANSAALTLLPLEIGATFGQYSALVPADVATVQFRDGWGCRVDFIEFGDDTPVQPTMVGKLATTANASSATVPVNTLPGFAAGQIIVVIITCRALLTAACKTTLATAGWILRGTPIETASLQQYMYVYSKLAAANEPNISIIHSGGRILVTTTNWINIDTTTPFHILPSYTNPLSFSGVGNNLLISPSITPTIADTTIISAVGHANNPTYVSGPSNFTSIDRFYASGNVGWLGTAYRKLPVAAATGTPSWVFSADPGGTGTSCTFALKSSAVGILKYGFDFTLQHNSPTSGQSLHNIRINP